MTTSRKHRHAQKPDPDEYIAFSRHADPSSPKLSIYFMSISRIALLRWTSPAAGMTRGQDKKCPFIQKGGSNSSNLVETESARKARAEEITEVLGELSAETPTHHAKCMKSNLTTINSHPLRGSVFLEVELILPKGKTMGYGRRHIIPKFFCLQNVFHQKWSTMTKW